MKSSFFLLGLALALLDVANSAPLRVDYDFQTRSLDNIYDSAKPVIREHIYELTADESSSTLVRRAPGKGRYRGKPKTDEQKKADAAKLMSAGPVASKATKEKEVADRQAEVNAKKTEVEAKGKEKEKADAEANARLTDRQKKAQANREEKERNEKKEEEEKKKQNPDQIFLDAHTVSRDEIERFWKIFSKPRKGLDGAGLVKVNDIAAAFRACVPKDKFLFWSSGGDSDDPEAKQDFDRAITAYEKNGRWKISTAAKKPLCANKHDIGPMTRDSMIKKFHEWIKQEQADEYLEKNPKHKGKKINVRLPVPVTYKANSILTYDHYWRVMSAGYAAGATGEVHYVRPARKAGETGDYPGKHWAELEFPELKINLQARPVVEIGIEFSADGKYNKATLPISDRITRLRKDN